MKVAFLPEARSDIRHSVRYYESKEPGLGRIFAAEIRAGIQRIKHSPLAWPVLKDDIRKCVARKFPYLIIYRIAQPSILILAVMHMRQRPDFWANRANQSKSE